MSTPIDGLTIEIDAKANSANSAIDSLCKKLDKLTTSLSRVDGSKLSGLASDLQQLGTAIQSIDAKSTNSISRLSENIAKLSTVNTSGLRSVASTLPGIAREFNKIGSISADAQKFSELANGISKLGNKSATKAIANIPQLSTAMKKLMTNLSTAPKVNKNLIDMTNALAKLARTGASSGRAAQSLSATFEKIHTSSGLALKGIQTINVSLKGLLKQLAPFVSIWQIFNLSKQAMEISSDLTEVQNVVDVTFGEFKQKLEDLASVSIPELGMSELTAKQIGSRFQAMGTAMGFSTEKMSDMSVELTRLTGDMASFYNVSQEEVGKSLQSVFTGEAEPLRKYGVDLTNATIQQWALNQGINANINSMTQLEKAQLRYDYVMSRTVAAQGDFIRTQDTWANQVRVLKEQLRQLASVIGGTLINALKPLVKALNIAMTQIISFAKVISDALGKIFGWKYEEGGGGMSADFDNASDSANDIADSTGETAKNVEKIQKGLRAFDELKVINLPEETAGTGGGTGTGSGAGTGGNASGGEWTQGESILKSFESDIDTLEKLGEKIGETLTNAMNSIEWDKIYEKARNFGKGLAEFLNGLISPELFGAVGRTVAGALNTAIYAALSFGETFDWEDFGLSIATGINEFFATFDFASLANTINVWVQGIWTTLKTAIKGIKWEDVWNGIKDFLGELDIETVEIILGVVLIKKILGLKLASTALSMIGTSLSRSIAQSIAQKLGLEIASNAGIKTALSAGLTKAFSNIGTTFSAGLSGLFGNSAGTSALAFISPIAKAITAIGSIIGGIVLGVSNFFSMWKNGFSWLNEALMLLGVTLTAIGAVILGAPALVTGIVAAAVAAIATIAVVVHDNWDAIKEWFSGIGEWFETSIITPVKESFQGLWTRVKEVFQGLWDSVSSIWEKASSWFSTKVINPIVNFFQGLWTRVKQIFEGLWIIIQAVWITVANWFNTNVITPVGNAFSSLWEKIKEIWSVVANWFNTNVITPVREKFTFLKEKVQVIFTALWSAVKVIWKEASSWFKSTVITPVQKAFKTMCDKVSGFFSNLWSGIKKGVTGAMNAVIGGIEAGINHIVNGINNIIGGFNKIVSWAAKVAEVDWGGVDLVPTVSLSRIDVSGYELGGFPKPYSLFAAGEGGVPELMGTVGGKTAVAGGAEITGISDTIRATSSEEIALLRQQNSLLQAILEKEFGISQSDIGKAAQNWARDYSRRTGREAYSF